MKILLVLLTVASGVFASTSGLAASATVPGTHSTIQAAVNAVQGTSGALVTINSNATFAENVVATQSVDIVAGTGFSPTIQPASGVAVSITPNETTTQSFTLRGLKIAGGGGGSNVVDLFANNTGNVNLTVDQVTISNPLNDSGVTGLNLRNSWPTGTGAKNVAVTDSNFVIHTADNQGASAITMLEGGTLTVTRANVTTTGGATAFDIRGAGGVPTPHIDLNIADSVFNISAPNGSYSSQMLWLIDDVSSDIRRNTFNFIGSAQGSVSGILIDYLTNGRSHTISQNTFLGTSLRAGSGISVIPFGNTDIGAQSVTVDITNNVMRNIKRGISASPQQAGDVAIVIALNNTIDRADVCLDLSANDGTTIRGRFNNNLCTNIAGGSYTPQGGPVVVYGAVTTYGGTGSTLSMTFANNGYYNNPNGNYSPTVSSIPDVGETVTTNPQYANAALGDLRLAVGSPAIDAGLTEAGVTVDHDGTSRPQAAAYDIGAYEGGILVPLAEVPTLGNLAMVLLGLLLGGVAVRQIAARREAQGMNPDA